MTLDWLEKPTESQSPLSRRPLHALLPDEIDDELPVHGVNERSYIKKKTIIEFLSASLYVSKRGVY